MSEEFYLHIFNKQTGVEAVPSNQVVASWAMNLMDLIYPERSTATKYTIAEIQGLFSGLERELTQILNATKACKNCNNELISKAFFQSLPELYRKMNTDIASILSGDPAAKSEFEIIRTYPGFLAISMYRIANALLKSDVPLIPRILTEYAHSQTGIDIHPGAEIGEYLYIDHGTGIVIGETTVIGDHVKLYQGVTLGALSVEKYMANTKRHPTIEDHVIIYSGATILGGETVIGDNSIIGGNVWLTKSVPSHSTVYHQSAIKVIETKHRD
ncbi:serine O-acetyltransferase [Pedobacter steynii]|uniref:Serine acetyltransferase n=1 Tax=Pedobacter steynii TaxID=430522 RepID=A0A1G9IWZ1_9SPHI|nr:serine O-acetyltransferase EpsC [Pedobacter steynii]NQX38066.1 serine acetyltransferase [Pedobacter steynii]SDL29364.1 serine O-acetyltransferase [Pedobacter steynii]